MSALSKLIDISEEFQVNRCLNGVRLAKPSSVVDFNSKNIGQLFRLPFNIYFTLNKSIIRKINDATAMSCGFISARSAEGRTIADVAKKETLAFERKHDQEVIESKQLKITEEEFVRKNDTSFTVISLKVPWYGDLNKIIGVFGCSIIMDRSVNYSCSQALTHILETGLFTPSQDVTEVSILPGQNINDTYLSQRQSQCAKLLVRGKTAKEIGQILGLSARTIEHYIQIIKDKFHVETKSALIDKLLETAS